MKAWQSLRFRLVASYLLLSLLLLTISGIVFSAVIAGYGDLLQRQRIIEHYTQVEQILDQGRAEQAPVAEVARRLRQQLPDLRVEQESLSRDLVRDFGRDEAHRAGPPELPTRRGDAGLFALGRLSPHTDFSWPVPYGSAVGGTLLRLTLRPQPGTVLLSLMGQVLLVLGLAFAVAAIIGWWLSRWLSRPLSRLADVTAAVAEGDFLQTVDATGVTELDRLVDQFNRMVLSLRESFRSLAAERDVARRFAADAAHELKTPVAALRVFQDVVGERPERLPQALPGMARQVERMDRVITGLLEMATLAEGTGIALVPGEVGDVIRHLIPSFSGMAKQTGHQFRAEGVDTPLPVRLDPRLLEQAVMNLLDNAFKFTPPGGQVRLRLEREGGEAVISVTDTGNGIPEEELPFIFERFHRGIDTQSIPGTGLGLSIVRESVRRLGGEVTVQSEVGKGSRFAIRLPLVDR